MQVTAMKAASGNQLLDNLRKDITNEYATLADGVSVAGRLCPKCFGGRSSEGSFSVTRQGAELAFICHRASCGFRGRAPVSGRFVLPEARDGESQRKPERPSYDAVGKSSLPEDIVARLTYKYGIQARDRAHGNIQWNEESNRIVLPIKDVYGDTYGYVLRNMKFSPSGLPLQYPKTLNYVSENRGAWYKSQLDDVKKKLIIVEDQLSAIRASSYLNSLALLGTNLPEEVLTLIKKQDYSNVYLALDADAFPVAIRMIRRLRNAGIKAEVVRLPSDIKDMPEEDFVDWMDANNIRWWQDIGKDDIPF
jgi:hypothetical protein